MSWRTRIELVLEKEPEIWLAYLCGQRSQDIPHLKAMTPHSMGWIVRLTIYIYKVIRCFNFGRFPKFGRAAFLVYAGTHNQKSALKNTIDQLRLKGNSVHCVTLKKLLTEDDIANCRYSAVHYTIRDIFKTLFLLIVRFRTVFTDVKKISDVLIENKFDTFLSVHQHLVYFDRLLEEVQPQYVVVGNDHNYQNRSLLALARLRGIKTIYMQHASVSSFFPALNFDYAFLDGLSAMKVYLQCEPNFPSSDMLLPNRIVFLSGQKKNVCVKSAEGTRVIGLAINALDKLIDIQSLLQILSAESFNIKVRWHPGLPPQALTRLKELLRDYPVDISDPRIEGLGAYFSTISILVAGNSSIHLEAALAGILPIYYEISKSDIPDYYGYVSNGLSNNARDIDELLAIISDIHMGRVKLNLEAIRFYSFTAGTKWEGLEGELVAEIVMCLDRPVDELPIQPVLFPSEAKVRFLQIKKHDNKSPV